MTLIRSRLVREMTVYEGPSPRQFATLKVISNIMIDTCAPPTVREIAAALGASSTNTVTCHLRALARKGLIELLTPRQARNVRLTSAGRDALRGR